jgi:hypothetical protein
VGDQPGRPNGRYLTGWRGLPDGIFIATSKFTVTNEAARFDYDAFPFPAATNAAIPLPYLGFTHLGQLMTGRDDGGEIIPLARGSIMYLNPADPLAADVLELPPGNSRTNSTMFNRVRIDQLTGRARVERFEMP